jgi:hypothetical protein
MRKLSYTKQGYLKPSPPIEMGLKELEHHFVLAFPNSERRRWLFDSFERYLYRLQDEVFPHFEVWVNGSFVSKVDAPNDIDFVVFLDYRVFEVREEKTLDKFWSFNLEKQGLDAYLVKDYPEGHEDYAGFLSLKESWYRRYTNSRKDPTGLVHQKNFVKIFFEP